MEEIISLSNSLCLNANLTLANIKVGTIFNYKINKKEEFLNCFLCLKKKLSLKGLELKIIRMKGSNIIFYLYRVNELNRYLQRDEIRSYLEQYGYSGDLDNYIKILFRRINYNNEYPHELALFLGIPLEDTKGYIDNNGNDFIKIGYWKVYHNLNEALKTFDTFDRCRRIYRKYVDLGLDLELVTVNSNI